MMIYHERQRGWTLGIEIEIEGEGELVKIRGTRNALENIKANYTRWNNSQKPS